MSESDDMADYFCFVTIFLLFCVLFTSGMFSEKNMNSHVLMGCPIYLVSHK